MPRSMRRSDQKTAHRVRQRPGEANSKRTGAAPRPVASASAAHPKPWPAAIGDHQKRDVALANRPGKGGASADAEKTADEEHFVRKTSADAEKAA